MRLYHLLYILLSVTACQSKPEQHEHHHGQATKEMAKTDSVGRLEQQILAIHDSVMPQMSELMRLKKAVSTKITETKDATVKENGLAISTELEKADRTMMSWMNQYNGDTLKKLQPAQAMEYLKDQHNKVTEMSRTMRTSIDHAKVYVQP